MASNALLAAQFERLAGMMSLLEMDRYRILAHERAARIIEGAPMDVAALARAEGGRARLMEIEGIGPKIADKAVEFATTGRLGELAELEARVPPGLPELLKIPGLGPRTASLLWREGGVTGLASLKSKIATGELTRIKGLGGRSIEKLQASMAVAAEGEKRMPLGLATPLAERIIERLAKVAGVEEIAYAGSLRRGKDTIGDIDILVASTDPAAVTAAFLAMPEVRSVISSGETRSSVRASMRADYGRWAINEEESGAEVELEEEANTPDAAPRTPSVNTGPHSGKSDPDARSAKAPKPTRKKTTAPSRSPRKGSPAGPPLEPPPVTTEIPPNTVQMDLRVIPRASWGAALLYFTGSKDHNIRLRERALKMGLTINEYGVFPETPEGRKTGTPPQKLGVKPLASRTEADMYAALNLPFYPPEVREDRGELDPGGAGVPRLIEASDIKAELHAHTMASDGKMPIDELAARAKARGFHTIAVTDHSKSSAIAGGLSTDRLLEHIDAVRRAAGRVQGITILAGSEVDIMADGSLDYPDAVLARLDVVVASPHSSLAQDAQTATKRLLRAIANPYVTILGHPTGRLIGRRAGLSPDMPALLAAAREHGVALEINAHWMRLDLRDTHAREAVGAGCLIAIDCDVHGEGDFDNLRYGVTTARRGWVTPAACVNTWTPKKLHAWLKSKR